MDATSDDGNVWPRALATLFGGIFALTAGAAVAVRRSGVLVTASSAGVAVRALAYSTAIVAASGAATAVCIQQKLGVSSGRELREKLQAVIGPQGDSIRGGLQANFGAAIDFLRTRLPDVTSAIGSSSWRRTRTSEDDGIAAVNNFLATVTGDAQVNPQSNES
ncbi:Transmembrane protein 242 [Plasmodiophora brassicae]|uniref:Uncharacterized protein n=1 Tax=Plasmodiophora brassicae TaxID=37360 RepID=A0A0G4IZA6_PLABS|nr:hypothetical protein PBRA_001669 [Plasmodiophora brassicae]SPQ93894.1 unnamed protein product [Plasmodiophora brassicae]